MKKSAPLQKRRFISCLMVLLLWATLITPADANTIRPIAPKLPNVDIVTPTPPADTNTIIPIAPKLPNVDIATPILSIDYDYTVANGKTTITKYKGSAASLTLPAQLGGYPVKVIGVSAFCANKTLTSVVIPEGVTTLKDMSFYSCSNLVNVTLPSTLTAITGEAFAQCTKLTSISLPDSLNTLDSAAFHDSGLTSLTLPKNLTDDYIYFIDMKNLTAIDVASDNPVYTSINGVLYTKDKEDLIQYPAAKPDTSFAVPDGVKLINYNAFSGCQYLQSVTIPNSVLLVSSSFPDCKSLTTVKFLGSGTKISYGGCFRNCTALTSVTLPSNLGLIPTESFKGCSSLKNITIPATVTSIESGAFQDCINLAAVNLPSGLKAIQGNTFYNCKALPSISIPDTVQIISGYSFYGCSNLSTVTIPASVVKIGSYAFKNCTNLVDARFQGDVPYTTGDGIFDNTSTAFKIYYPLESVGWETPTWCGYPTQGYLSQSALPVVKIPANIVFPIPSTTSSHLPLEINQKYLIPTGVVTTPDIDPELLPDETSPAPASSIPTGTTEIELYLGNPNYTVNGKSQSMDVNPVLLDNRLFLPACYIALPLGAKTDWDETNQKVTVTYGTTVIELWIGSNMAKINGVDKMIDPDNPNVKPIIVPPGRTMLPLSFLAENLGCEVQWLPESSQIKVHYSGNYLDPQPEPPMSR